MADRIKSALGALQSQRLLAFGLMYVYAKWSKIDTKSIKADDIIINEEVKKK